MNSLPSDEEVGYEYVDIEDVNLCFEFKEYELIKDFKDIKYGQKTKDVFITANELGYEHYTFRLGTKWYSLTKEEFMELFQ